MNALFITNVNVNFIYEKLSRSIPEKDKKKKKKTLHNVAKVY